MASRAVDDDGVLEKKRFKGLVYTRKRFRGSKGKSTVVQRGGDSGSRNENLEQIERPSEELNSTQLKAVPCLDGESSNPKRQRGQSAVTLETQQDANVDLQETGIQEPQQDIIISQQEVRQDGDNSGQEPLQDANVDLQETGIQEPQQDIIMSQEETRQDGNKGGQEPLQDANMGFQDDQQDVNILAPESLQDEYIDAQGGQDADKGFQVAGKDAKIGTEDLGVEADARAQVTQQDADVHAEDPWQDVHTGGIQDFQQNENRGIQDPLLGTGAGNLSHLNRITINLASRTKQQKRQLKLKLDSELDTVRNLLRKIDAREEIGSIGGSGAPAGQGFNYASGTRQVHSEVASVGVHRQQRPWDKLRLSVLDNRRPVGEYVEREKRTPKANQFYNNSEFLLANDKFPCPESNMKPKSNGQKQGVGGHMGSKFYRSCSSLLEKLMKHKHGWVFNKPVDVEALNLHDYYDFIKHPMDLGTIKSRLHKNRYNSPKQFAEDVRLTFNNAMTYNPKGHDVHMWAEQLLKIFEDRWVIIESDYNREMRFAVDYEASRLMPNAQLATPVRPPPLDMWRVLDRSESMKQTTDPMPRRPMSLTPSARTPAPKKPKAKDPCKRNMTAEEKQKLIANLQSLPSEKLENVSQIIQRNNNSVVTQHKDEIEVDIDAVDVETLWELDRMVINYKKNLSKQKKKAELASQTRAQAGQSFQDKHPAPVMARIPGEIERGETNMMLSGVAQWEKQGDIGSRLSSSSSSSSDSDSSSSDSDSGSSSSGSDAGHSS